MVTDPCRRLPAGGWGRWRWTVATFAVAFHWLGSSAFADLPSLRQTVDRRLAAAWEREGITPAPPATDSEFLRRVYLDLVGGIPTWEETREFLNDPAADKRTRLIDRLLDDPRYARHRAEVWDMVLFGRNPPGFDTRKRQGFQRWLRETIAAGAPYDQWAGDILRAAGNTEDDGAPMYLVQYKNAPEDAAVAVTRVFLGVQVECARCHDHPFESWSQEDFYGVAAFFARLQVVNVGKKNNRTMYAIGETSVGDVLFTGAASQQAPGQKGRPIAPKYLLGETLDEPPSPESAKPERFANGKMPPAPKFSRKDKLAEWIASPENPYFARAVANRVFAQFLGRGLVHPVDNMTPSNAPSHPELLDELTAQLKASQFDLRWYIRELLHTRAYQLSSRGDVSRLLPQWFERARIRPLSAEELADSWRTAVRYEATAAAQKKKTADRFAPLTGGYMLRFFGQPNNGVGDFQGGLHEHLFLGNGGLSSVLTQAPGSLHAALLEGDRPWAERVEELFMSTLSRRPSDSERERFVQHFEQAQDARPAMNEAIWSLLTCSEFRFNH